MKETREIPVDGLKGEDLDQAFDKSMEWLMQVAYRRYSSGYIHKFNNNNGHISLSELEDGLVFNIVRFSEDVLETYGIRPDKGLVSFKRETDPSQTQSIILGNLPFEEDYRYFVCNIRQEETVQFGTHWLKSESGRNPHANWAIEEMKRAAIKVVRVCQG